MKNARNFAILALIALAVLVLPGGGPLLGIIGRLLTIAFFSAIAFLGYRLYREHQFSLQALEDRHRLVLYAAVGVAFLTFAATPRLFGAGGAGIVVWIGLLVICSYAAFWVYTQSRRYG